MDDLLELFAHTGDGVWAVDTDHRILFWNRAAEELLGYTAAEAVGRHCYELLAGRDSSGNPCCGTRCSPLERAAQHERVDSFDLRVRNRDNRACLLNVSLIAVPGKDEDAPLLALVHLFRRLAQGSNWPASLRIHLLGPITVERADGSPVGGSGWRRAKVRALLALLALRRGRSVRRDELVEMLWPDLDYSAALHNLNTTVYRLRRSLEPALKRGAESSFVHCEGDSYLLNGGKTHWLDVEAFEAGIAGARREPDSAVATDRYREALALYRGEFLADLEPDIVDCLLERERLCELYLTALEELGALHAQLKQRGEATAVLHRALALDPCREGVVHSLMRLALDHGERGTAIAHYRSLERALWQEYQLLPSQETCLLYELALRGPQMVRKR
jgi:PAS domain S-box-containing protein